MIDSNLKGGADLHLHTIASDGTLKPSELVKKAQKMGFTTIAITDHDATDSIQEALTTGKEVGLEVIPGIEISSTDNHQEVHILGYNIDPNNKKLKAMLNKMTDFRKNVAAKMVAKLNKLGIAISYDRVKEIAQGKVVSRVHIAMAMQEKGYIKEINEAFTDEYIGNNGKAYVGKYKISPQDTIKLIKQAKGVPVLAHPIYLAQEMNIIENKIAQYTKLGIEGLEVYYSQHTPEQTEHFKNLAQKHNLLITGGSDCHGQTKNLLGTIRLESAYVEALKKRFSPSKKLAFEQIVKRNQINQL